MFTTADAFPTTFSDMVTAGIYAWDFRAKVASVFHNSEDGQQAAKSGKPKIGRQSGRGNKRTKSSKSWRNSEKGGNCGGDGGKSSGDSGDGNACEDNYYNGGDCDEKLVSVDEDLESVAVQVQHFHRNVFHIDLFAVPL